METNMKRVLFEHQQKSSRRPPYDFPHLMNFTKKQYLGSRRGFIERSKTLGDFGRMPESKIECLEKDRSQLEDSDFEFDLSKTESKEADPLWEPITAQNESVPRRTVTVVNDQIYPNTFSEREKKDKYRPVAKFSIHSTLCHNPNSNIFPSLSTSDYLTVMRKHSGDYLRKNLKIKKSNLPSIPVSEQIFLKKRQHCRYEKSKEKKKGEENTGKLKEENTTTSPRSNPSTCKKNTPER